MKQTLSQAIKGGFTDSPPAPMVSPRHLRRFVLIVAGIALALLVQSRRSSVLAAPASKLPLYGALILAEMALAWFVTIGVRARGYRVADVIGARRRTIFGGVLDLALAAGAVLLLHSSAPILSRLLGSWSSNTGFLLPAARAESLAWVGVSLAAGACEEFVFRGYLQRQLWSITRHLPAALLLQSVIFGSGHLYQGWKPALITALYGLIFGLLAAWRRSILPGALGHAAADIVAGLRL